MSKHLSLQGGNIWWPDSLEELAYVKQAFPNQEIHVGIRAVAEDVGILHSDYSLGVGFPGLTEDEEGNRLISHENDTLYYFTPNKCLAYSTAQGGLSVATPCIQAMTLCKSPLGKLRSGIFSP